MYLSAQRVRAPRGATGVNVARCRRRRVSRVVIGVRDGEMRVFVGGHVSSIGMGGASKREERVVPSSANRLCDGVLRRRHKGGLECGAPRVSAQLEPSRLKRLARSRRGWPREGRRGA